MLSSGQLVNLHNIRLDAANWFLFFGFLLFFFFFQPRGWSPECLGSSPIRNTVCVCVCVYVCVCVGSYEAWPNFTMQKSGNG